MSNEMLLKSVLTRVPEQLHGLVHEEINIQIGINMCSSVSCDTMLAKETTKRAGGIYNFRRTHFYILHKQWKIIPKDIKKLYYSEDFKINNVWDSYNNVKHFTELHHIANSQNTLYIYVIIVIGSMLGWKQIYIWFS